MKKRIFLLICAVMCLFFVLCSCGCNDTGATQNSQNNQNDDGQNQQGGTGGNQGDTSGSQIITPPANKNEGSTDIVVPETKCSLSERGHYWSEVEINKNTSASGSVGISGKCYYCGDSLYTVAVSMVDYNEWKNALSKEELSSFTVFTNGTYADYDKNGCIEWKIENGTFVSNYFINSTDKSSEKYAENFAGFSLQYNDFKYDTISRTYVYWINENSYIELGFADGHLLSHSTVSKKNDREEKSTTLYLNHKQIEVSLPDFVEEKYENALSLDAFSSSSLSSSVATSVYNELKNLSFDYKLEASLLENDKLCIYFYLDAPGINPISNEAYSNASVIIIDGHLTEVTFGDTTIELGK